LVNKQTTNAFWNNSNFKFYEKRNVMRYNQKHAYQYGFSPNANCPIFPCTDSALHLLPGCQHTKIRNMIIKRHNTASVLIVQALQKGPCGADQIAYTDVGSADTIRARPRSEKHCQQNTALMVASKTNSTCFKSLFSSCCCLCYIAVHTLFL